MSNKDFFKGTAFCMAMILVGIILISVVLSGCTPTYVEKKSEPLHLSRFEVVERTGQWLIVTDKETNVMYSVSEGNYNRGTFTLLVDADGKPLLWRGDAE